MKQVFTPLEPQAILSDTFGTISREPRLAPLNRPWVLTNMITSADGATAVQGLSGGLGAESDSEMLLFFRAVADVILVGAGTATAENYGPANLNPSLQEHRLSLGQTPTPRIAVVSAGLSLDPELRLFSNPDKRPLVITIENAPSERASRLAKVADLVHCGESSVDLPLALARLKELGAEIVLCEGGPSLNGALVAEDLIDEWNITYSPVLAGGSSTRSAHSAQEHSPRTLRLDRVITAQELLFCRYVRGR